MDKIISGEDLAHRDGAASQREWIIQRCRKLGKLLETPFTDMIRGEAVEAEINYGRWIALCPDCGGAEYVSPDEQIFYCFSCGNIANAGNGRPVKFPADRQAIEAAILERPVIERNGANRIERALLAAPVLPMLSRSWKPGESVSDLRMQAAEVIRRGG